MEWCVICWLWFSFIVSFPTPPWSPWTFSIHFLHEPPFLKIHISFTLSPVRIWQLQKDNQSSKQAGKQHIIHESHAILRQFCAKVIEYSKWTNTIWRHVGKPNFRVLIGKGNYTWSTCNLPRLLSLLTSCSRVKQVVWITWITSME